MVKPDIPPAVEAGADLGEGGGFVGLQPSQNIWSSLTEEHFSDMAVIAMREFQ